MGGRNSVNYDRESASAVNDYRTLLLVGRTGNGKSSTGNSITGKKLFESKSSSAGVTMNCELQSTTLEDGQILQVIDTPGLFDYSLELEFTARELWSSVNMAAVDAVLLVLSVRTRFSREEAQVVKCLQTTLGSKMSNNMIVVFTGGDDLEDNDETLDDYLGRDCPEPLNEVLDMCGNRRVLFDNKTEDEKKKAEQLRELLSHVNVVVKNNNGVKTCADHLFEELKIVSKMKEDMFRLKKQLENNVARLEAESSAQKAKMDETNKLIKDLERAERELQELTHKEKRDRIISAALVGIRVLWNISAVVANVAGVPLPIV